MNPEFEAVRDLWLRCYHPTPEAAATVVCFPHAGGSASYFLPLARLLAPTVRMYAVQYPGRQDRRHEPCLESVTELARQVSPLVASLPGAVALFGHSLGASVAFEVCRAMADDAVATLFVSGRPAPSHHRSHDVHKRDDQGIVSEIARMSGTDPKLLEDPELLAFVLPAIRSDYTAAETYAYQPGAPLACPVVALNGADDEFVSRAEVDNWRAHTGGAFEMREFPGDHFYLNTAWPQIAHLLTGRLSGVAGRLSGVAGRLSGVAATP